MDVKEAIEKRRSIRKYKDMEVEGEKIAQLMDAINLAPSAHNAQTTRVMLLKGNDERLRGIFKQGFIMKAPLVAVFLSNQKAYGINEAHMENASIVDASIAATMMVLRAQELGLGTCFVAWFDKEKLKKALDVKGYYIPFVVTLGYPDENPEAILIP